MRASALAFVLVAMLPALPACSESVQREIATVPEIPPPAEKPAEKLATFGGGCFWCTEAVYQELAGVLGVESGYAGGHVEDPSYDEVCLGTTGHAEVVQVRFDPSQVTYAELLEVFFRTHDPTTLNRQGADVGTQYRSAIFHHDEEQQKTAQATIEALDAAGAFSGPIVTEVVPYERFWPADDDHQDYYANNPGAGYCRVLIRPKLDKLRKAFADKLKTGESKEDE